MSKSESGFESEKSSLRDIAKRYVEELDSNFPNLSPEDKLVQVRLDILEFDESPEGITQENQEAFLEIVLELISAKAE